MNDELPESPLSPAMEGFYRVLLAGNKNPHAAAGILEALDEPLSDRADDPVSDEERVSSLPSDLDQPPQKL
jgi:hypothetical protein